MTALSPRAPPSPTRAQAGTRPIHRRPPGSVVSTCSALGAVTGRYRLDGAMRVQPGRFDSGPRRGASARPEVVATPVTPPTGSAGGGPSMKDKRAKRIAELIEPLRVSPGSKVTLAKD